MLAHNRELIALLIIPYGKLRVEDNTKHFANKDRYLSSNMIEASALNLAPNRYTCTVGALNFL